MPSFQAMFEASKGRPIEWRGRTLHLFDRIPLPARARLRVALESVGSDWRQGIYLDVDGEFCVEGKLVPRALVLWSDTFPGDAVIEASTRRGEVHVKNVWDPGDGAMHSWHNGAAMIVEIDGARRRYRCNDGRADEDFDDLVFTIDVLPDPFDRHP